VLGITRAMRRVQSNLGIYHVTGVIKAPSNAERHRCTRLESET
jgi:hypothetical protein